VSVAHGQLVGKASQQRVELREVLDRRRLGEVGDRADIDVVATVEDSEEGAADATESVETNGEQE
jgi:hypothetical protein